MFLLVSAYPGCPGSKAVKRSLLLLLLPIPRILNGHSATDRKLCRCAARNESTLAQIFTMDEFGAGTLSLCRVSDGAAHEYQQAKCQ